MDTRTTKVILSLSVLILCSALPTIVRAAVGRTVGHPNVSSVGTGSYSIPLVLPPGTAGLTPSVSIVYSHSSGDGLLGMGFNIGGLSTLARCNKTIAQDGVAESPRLVVDDSYCLDGNKLRLTSGTYGTAGSTYQAELETFSNVTASGSAGNGPASWEVKLSNGLIYDYGGTADSAIESVGSTSIRTWALSKIRDRQGNYIEFVYTDDIANGSYRPAEIRYTANSLTGTSAATKILFTYETATRPDPLYAFRYGSGANTGYINEFKRLDKIDVIYIPTSQTVRTYDLTYEVSGGVGSRSRLSTIQECVGADCLQPTQFQWTNGTPLWSSAVSTGQSVLNSSTSWDMDINGDGLDDVVYSSNATSGSGTWYYLLSTGGGFGAPVNTGIGNWNYSDARRIDWDGDGREDLLVPCNGAATWCVLQANGAGFTYFDTAAALGGTAAQTLSVDVNGDGRHDLVRIITGTLPHRLGLRLRGSAGFDTEVTAWTASSNQIRLTQTFASVIGVRRGPLRRVDFNGDGREDFVFKIVEVSGEQGVPDSAYWVPFFGKSTLITSGTSFSTANAAPANGDFNGDGLTDMVYLGTSNCITKYGVGYGVSGPVTGPPCSTLPEVRDFDGDGLSDLIRPSTTANWQVSRSTGNGFTAFADAGFANYPGTHMTDVNGDGLDDLTWADSSTNYWTYRLHNGVAPDLLDRVTDGYGMYTDFNYVATTQSGSCYSRDSAAPAFPQRAFRATALLVCDTTASNGIGGAFSTTYAYYNANQDLQGRGFLGFERKSTRDSRDNLVQIQTFLQNFPYIGMLGYSVQLQSNGVTKITEVTNTAATYAYSSGYSARALPYYSQSVQKDYEAGGAYNGQLLRTTTTVNTVDASSGLTADSTSTILEASTANGLNAGQSHSIRTYHSSVFNDFGNWCFGRPAVTQSINSHSMTGGTQITRTSSVTWDGVSCRPTQSVIEPGNGSLQVTTDYGYDNFGNVNLETITPVSGQGQAARSRSSNWGATGRFPVTVGNMAGQNSTVEWDLAKGVPTSVTDPNLLTVTYQYDSFGRKSRETRPDGTATDFVLGACNAGNSYCGESDLRFSVQVIARDTSNGAIRTDSQYFDGLGRSRYNYQQMLNGGSSINRTTYDAAGRVQTRSLPFISGDPVWYTTYTYDSVGRLERAERPASEGDPTVASTQFSYQGLRKVTTDTLGRSSTQVYSAIGQIVQAIDAAGSDTDYEYDAFGNLLKWRDVLGNETTQTYNVRGMKLTSSDPDLGAWSYNYFPLGELKSQTDAKAQTTTFTYDVLSRPLTRVESEATTSWTWDTATNGVGQLASVAYGGNYAEAYAFDSIGRRSQLLVTIDSVTYQYDYDYQSTSGLLDTITYPVSIGTERFKVRYGYQYGWVASVQSYINNVAGTTYWQSLGTNARGQTVLEQFGNGLQTSSGYDRITGLLDDTLIGPGASGTIQNLAYSWDRAGNLTERRDLNQSLTEHFYYDNLDRLDYSTLNGVTNLDVTYNAIGNITYKSDVGSYAYHATRKHAVTSTSGLINNTYGYDANGNMSSRNGNSTTWASYNYPTRIFLNSTTRTDFRYTHDRKLRYQQIYEAGNVEEWWYVGGLFEKRKVGSTYEYRHIIKGPAGPIAVRKRISSGSSVWYLGPDHLGSTSAVTNSAGTAIVNESYEAFGERRGSNWTGVPTSADNTYIETSTKHGFTFHENLTNLNLIHMQGRVFDPVIGRFISADPYVQEPYNSQGLNRYSYVNNNPMRYVDPSGFNSCDYGANNGDGSCVEGVVVTGTDDPDPDYQYDPAPPDAGGGGSGGGGGSNSDPPDNLETTVEVVTTATRVLRSLLLPFLPVSLSDVVTSSYSTEDETQKEPGDHKGETGKCSGGFLKEFIAEHGSISVSANGGGKLVGAGFSISVSATGLDYWVGGGLGMGSGVSVTADVSEDFGPKSGHPPGFGIMAGVSGGNGTVGGQGSLNIGPEGGTASAGIGWGLGFGGSFGVGYADTLIEWSLCK